MNDRLEEWKALLADKTGKLFAAAESGELIDHFAQAISALESARADLELERLAVGAMAKMAQDVGNRLRQAEADRDRWKARAGRLEDAIRWALGERDDFPPKPSAPNPAPYYWRHELRKRAALEEKL